jgi:sn-glycerol 3-phosphate transport system ATP-binding protein/multiple sugar transport system ATP-binding protein
MTMASVAVERLTKRFGSNTILDGVELAIPEGAFAVLVGPSGCGKSTLLRLLAGLELPTSGTVRFGERDVTRLEPRERDIAMVFQSYALYPHLTVRDNLAFGLTLRKVAPAEIASRVAEASRMLGLDALLDRMPKALSGGQRQRVAMGRAIVRRPGLFLFDEPLSNLDAALRGQVRVEIRRLHESLGTTSIYVTHDQVEAMTLADVMFVLNRGKVEQFGAPLDIYDRPRTRFVAGFLGSPPMNFLEATLVRDGASWLADAAGVRFALGEPLAEGLSEGRRVTVGVRPHDVTLVEHATDAANLAVHFDFAEKLGGETYAHSSIGGSPFVVRLEPTVDVRLGAPRRLAVSPSRIHLFDADTGLALRC